MTFETDRHASPRACRARRATGRLAPAALLCLALAACGPRDPLDMKVDARNFLALSMWESDAGRRLSAQQLADFREALQEIKFHVMAEGTASGGANVDNASLEMMDGRTDRDVLRMGLGWELDRAQEERSGLVSAMRQNARMRTRPGDAASANYLSDLHDRQLGRLNAADAQISRVRERLAASGLEARVAAQPGARVDDALEPVSEDQAPVLQTPKKGEH